MTRIYFCVAVLAGMMLSVSGAPAMETLTVVTRASGAILMDGHAATLAALQSRLAKMQGHKAVILYRRDPPGAIPPPAQTALFRILQDSHIMISMSGGPNG
jgi:hypothetical protein